MIVGDGMIARACDPIDRDDIIIFASGVSDSTEKNKAAFIREEKLLDSFLKGDRVLVYFSSKVSYENPYFIHKQKMCDKVRDQGRHIILRLSQVVGNGGNMNNLFNQLWKSIVLGSHIKAYPVLRSLIDVDDVVMVLSHLLDKKLYGEHNLYQVEPMPVIDIIRMMEKQLGETANVTEIEGEPEDMPTNSGLVNTLIEPLRGNYTENVIKKYI